MLDWKSIKRYWTKRALAQPDGVVGLARYEEGVAICHGILNSDGQWTITDADFEEVVEEEDQIAFVQKWVREHSLQSADCHFVLSTKEYELLLLEAPPVEDSELLDAALWRVKDLIKNPIEEMAVDVMRLPTDAYRGRQNMIYAVAAKKTDIKANVKFIKRCDLIPAAIDIPEMCWRNLLSYIDDAEVASVATLSLRRSSGIMVIYSHHAMYLTRQIEMGIKNFETNEPGSYDMDNGVLIDRLSLDIQRSLDYYESQVGKGIVKRIYFLPTTNEHINIIDDLKSYVQTTIEPFNIYESISVNFDKSLTSREQAYCLPVIGSSMRMEEIHAAN